ncbi:hypothetical protein GCM10027275_42470 [Rhabdobacter roseus]|uniref:Uncharacterized protein YndB with AHSA1/START domain n=1 Tax=Rhabdobacter roseus TaxID=1655419 RepID=A0A840TPI3_9BACT|nr:SRPBCC family protein [Rhabdobacter roseus]MBB5286226.1 uncharacterized protein YndB with AHSA1/START domain [Rhabdobacter roseus]
MQAQPTSPNPSEAPQVPLKNIHAQAPVRCTKEILIDARPEKVWAVLTGIDQWASWQTDIANSRLNGPLRPESTFDWKTGGTRIHSTLHTVTPHRYFGWTGKALGTKAIHNWTLTEVDGQTKVLVEESMEGLLVRLFKHSFNRSLEKGMLRWLELLKVASEKKG